MEQPFNHVEQEKEFREESKEEKSLTKQKRQSPEINLDLEENLEKQSQFLKTENPLMTVARVENGIIDQILTKHLDVSRCPEFNKKINSKYTAQQMQGTSNGEAEHSKLRERPTQPKNDRKFSVTRRLWTTEEDTAIIELINEFGTKQWCVIANQLESKYNIKGRTGKQCRERWHNHLNPEVIKRPLSQKEEWIIFENHIKYGNRWADIAKLLNGRTDNAVKNFFYATLRRQLRKVFKKLKKSQRKEPKEITLEYIHHIIKEHHISYNVIDNGTVRKYLEKMDEEEKSIKVEEAKEEHLEKLCKFQTTEKKSEIKEETKEEPKIHSFPFQESINSENYCLFLEEKAQEICGQIGKEKQISPESKEKEIKYPIRPIPIPEPLSADSRSFDLQRNMFVRNGTTPPENPVDHSNLLFRTESQDLIEEGRAFIPYFRRSFNRLFSDRSFQPYFSQNDPLQAEECTPFFPDTEQKQKCEHIDPVGNNEFSFSVQTLAHRQLYGRTLSPLLVEGCDLEHSISNNCNSRNYLLGNQMSSGSVHDFRSTLFRADSGRSDDGEFPPAFAQALQPAINSSPTPSLFSDLHRLSKKPFNQL